MPHYTSKQQFLLNFWEIPPFVVSLTTVSLPYRIATLLYAFDEKNRVLLIERNREPNKGCFSPPGGKLQTDSGESPHGCAIREAKEETGRGI